jgi:hypothetical protein
MSAVMIRSVRNFQSGTDVRPRGPRLMTGNHGVVSASTKDFPPFRLRMQWCSDRGVVFSLTGRIELEDVAEFQRVLSLEAAGQDVVSDLQDVTRLRGNRRGAFDRLLGFDVADPTEAP